MLNGRHIERIRQAYLGLWNAIRNLSGGRARDIEPRELEVRLKGDRISVCNRRAWVIEAVSARKDVYDIFLAFRNLVRGRGRVKAPELELEKCSIGVLYLPSHRPTGVRPRSVRGVRFDYSEQNHHPVYHAQVDYEVISPEIVGFPYEPGSARCDTPRVPTAPMDLAGTLYMIMHDHFPDEVEEGWDAGSRRATDRLPRLPLGPFADYVRNGRCIECPWWYPHPRT